MSGPEKEETLNYRYSDSRRLAKAACGTCGKQYWVFVYSAEDPTIKKCCACGATEFRETYITAKWLSRM